MTFSLSVRDEANCSPLPVHPDWSVSDPTRVSIDSKTGVAICLAPTDGPVTVNAAAYAGSATLICR